MALTRSFKDLVESRVERDPAFGAALLREGLDLILSGDVDGEHGKACLGDTHAHEAGANTQLSSG